MVFGAWGGDEAQDSDSHSNIRKTKHPDNIIQDILI